MATSKKKEKPTKEIGQHIKMPHTYIIIACVVLLSWLITFIVPIGKFDTHEVTYKNAEGDEKSRTVLINDSFRYKYNYNQEKFKTALEGLITDSESLETFEIDSESFSSFLSTDSSTWTEDDLDAINLTEPTLYALFGDTIYDTSKKLKHQANIWGTEDVGGFGVLNYVYEGLVTGDRSSSAVAIVMIILVCGGSFGIILKTGSIDAGMYAFIRKVEGYEILVIPALTFLFSLGGAVFGMSEECIPFSMIVVPFVIAMGYDSLVGIGITFVASQVGNAMSWMNPFGVAIAQGIAGVPVLSGSTFRLITWFITTLLTSLYLMAYAKKIMKNPTSSIVYDTDSYFRDIGVVNSENPSFTIGDILVILSFFSGMVWMVWGVVKKGYYIGEIASIFFVMGLVAGILGVIFKLNDMTPNDVASSFQSGAADLVGAALVVGMAKGIILVLGGTEASQFTVLNTILHTVGDSFKGLPAAISGIMMYIFQTVFNFFVTSGTGQAALTMPIMAPLADLVGVSRQIAVLAYQMGAGFADAIVPTSASLIGVLGVARIDWGTFVRWQYKMQFFFFVLGCVFIVVATAINFS